MGVAGVEVVVVVGIKSCRLGEVDAGAMSCLVWDPGPGMKFCFWTMICAMESRANSFG